MRDRFREYYRPTTAEFAQLWATCTFAFDANVLLDLYRYSGESRSELLSLLDSLKARIWVSHQAALEFHRNRLAVITKAHEPATRNRNKLEEVIASVHEVSRQHPYISEKVSDEIKGHLTAAIAVIDRAAGGHPDLLVDDEIGNRVAAMFAGKTGKPYPVDQLAELHRKIEARFAEKVPPGYMDVKDKSDDRKYGDAIVWFQLMDYAKSTARPMIFVSAERKEDWWLRHNGRTIGPRPELRLEFREYTGQDFYLYETAQFIELSKTELNFNVSNSLVAEAKEIEKAAQIRSTVIRRGAGGVSATGRLALSKLTFQERAVLELEFYEREFHRLNTRLIQLEERLKPILSDALDGQLSTETARVGFRDLIEKVESTRTLASKAVRRVDIRRERLGMSPLGITPGLNDPEFLVMLDSILFGGGDSAAAPVGRPPDFEE